MEVDEVLVKAHLKLDRGQCLSLSHPEFADVTLTCEDGHQLEAHKVTFDGSRPQTTTHTHWSELEDFIFHPKYFSSAEIF